MHLNWIYPVFIIFILFIYIIHYVIPTKSVQFSKDLGELKIIFCI